MATLAAAQASALASLVADQPPQTNLLPSSRPAGGQLHVTGLDGATHAAVFQSHQPSTSHATQQPTDYSALMLDEWLEEYMRERSHFTSVSLFCEIKLRELIELTNTLHVGVTDHQPNASADTTRSVPSKLRTAVCIDLLDILIASVIQPEMGGGGMDLVSGAAPAAQSRQALGQLLLRLRDELIKSIYVQPVPAHLFLQYTPYFNKPLAPLLGQQQRKSLPAGALTSRGRQGRNEEKMQEGGHGGSLTQRGRLTTTHSRTSASSGILVGPPSCIPEFLKCTEWFSLIPQHVARNRHLAEQARIIMIPSKLFRLRQIQKKVVGNMTTKWRTLLLKWKFWEWREIVRQKRKDKEEDRASKVVTRLTNIMSTLACKIHFYQWRQLIIYKKYKSMKEAKLKGLTMNTELIEETFKLSEETHAIREEIIKLDQSNIQLSNELKLLRLKLEHSQVDLQDTSKHQSQCSELLDALRSPLKTVFQGIQAQLDSFAQREFISIHPLLTTIVDQEYQSQLEPLGHPSLIGIESWNLLGSLSQGSPKQRLSVCAELVARWLALQLKLSQQVLQGGQGQYSEYLVKLENQQRIAAALARIRQLCSANPPTTLPSFPIIKRLPAGKAASGGSGGSLPAGGGSLPAALGGGLPLARSRARTVSLQPNISNEPGKDSTKPATDKDGSEESAGEDGATGPGGNLPQRQRSSRTSRMSLKKLSMTGKVDDLPPPPPGSETVNKNKRLQEGQAIPTGTLSTPIRVFSQLRDTDRPETIFSISAVMMHADGEVAKSLKLPAERRWTEDERSKVTALRSLMETLRVTPDMKVSDMDTSVGIARDGIDATHSALSRARSAQARMQAIEDEVFAQSVKLLHQQSQRKHRHGERENNMPTDMLDLDLNYFSDVLDSSTISKIELLETNKVFEEYCRDLYKIFTYYCLSHQTNTANSLLNNVTQTEPRMGNAEFWRFVRDCKLKLQQTAQIDLIFLRVADRSHLEGGDHALPSSAHTTGPLSTASLIAQMSEGMSLSETEAMAERARQQHSVNKDVSFKQFGECLMRLGLIKYPNEKYLSRKLKNLLLSHVLPNSSQKALAFHKLQQAAAQANPSAGGSSSTASAGQIGGGAGGGVNVNLNTLEVDQVFRKYNVLLRQIFQIYARITPNFMTMTFNDFLGFAREFELLHKYVTQHDLKQLFSNVIRDMPSGGTGEIEVTNLTGGGIVTNSVSSAASGGGGGGVPTLAVALEKAGKAALKRATTTLGGGGVPGGVDDSASAGDDEKDGGAPAKELSYKQFLELLAAVSHYVVRNPYYALHDRVEKFIASVLASRKKLPTKTFRSAI